MNKEIFITTGYMGSGSSAVTDLLSEFLDLNVCNGDFEYIFMHCPDGVFDLEDKLLKSNNAVRSDEAIHRFISQMNNLYCLKNYWPGMYKKFVSINFMNIINQFIESLINIKIKNGYWYFSEMPISFKSQCKHYIYRFKKKFLNKKLIKKPLNYDELLFSIPTEEEFYSNAQILLSNFFDFFQGNKIVLDQFFLPHNLYRLKNYCKDAKIIVVDRDPRDVFYSNKYIWLKNREAIPYPIDVKDFCNYYKRMRQNEKIVNDNVLRIHFEDLLFRYDKTLSDIISFLGLDPTNHKMKFQKFNPDISKNNTQLFEKYGDLNNEQSIICEMLNEYLYDFDTNLNFEESDINNVF